MSRIIFLSLLLISPAQAGVVHVPLDKCVFTIGNYCPLESLGLTAIGAIGLGILFAGVAGVVGTLRIGKGTGPETPEALVYRCNLEIAASWAGYYKASSTQDLREALSGFVPVLMDLLRREYPSLAALDANFVSQLALDGVKMARTHSSAEIDQAVQR